MENWTPIDDLFREKLQQGKEQINLGAWANMERMLDGKNPYSADQEKKKRRILPFLGLFLLFSGLFTAGYYAVDKLQPTNAPQKTAEIVNPKSASNSANEDKAPLDNQSVQSNQVQPQSNSIQQNLPENSTKSSHSQNIQQPQSTLISKAKTSSELTSLPAPIKPIIDENKPNHQTKTNRSAKNQQIDQSSIGNGDEEALSNNEESSSSITSQQNKLIASNNTTKKVSNIKQPTYDTIPQVEVKEKISRNRNGSIKEIEFDTIAITSQMKEKYVEPEIAQSKEIASNNLIQQHASDNNKNTNPRYVKLNADQEEQIKLNANLPFEDNKKVKIESTSPVTSSSQNESSSQTEKVEHSKKETSYFQDMMSAAKTNYEKLHGKLDIRRLSLYPGMSVGINAALFNTPHNYGGFHVGFNNLIPVNNYFSVLAELKLFYRNNSGFTVNDINSTTINKTVDNTTLASQNKNIYSYQIDSNVKKYNFKSFTSIELPFMLQAHYKKITAYGGINFAYNFKLKVNEINTNYHPERFDTVGIQTNYFYPENKSFQYARDDFGSRFGIGYTIGTSFSFNPNLFVDLRLTQNTWDNTKTNSARDVSNGFFKVPFIQFSIGYRFKKYTPGN